MQVLIAVIVATALMLPAYNPKINHKRNFPQRQLQQSWRGNRRMLPDTFNPDTTGWKLPALPGMAHLAGAGYSR